MIIRITKNQKRGHDGRFSLLISSCIVYFVENRVVLYLIRKIQNVGVKHFCRTSNRGKGLLSFKYVILLVCEQRHDEWGENVSIRVNGAMTDLHSADARYHDDCGKNFIGSRNVKSAPNQEKDARSSDQAFVELKRMLAFPEKNVNFN